MPDSPRELHSHRHLASWPIPIRSKGFLDYDADPLVHLFSRLHHAVCTESGDDLRKILRRDRQIKQAVAARPEFFIQFRKVVLEPFETVVVVKIRLEVLHAIKEGTKPKIRFTDASSFDDSILHFGNERLGQEGGIFVISRDILCRFESDAFRLWEDETGTLLS